MPRRKRQPTQISYRVEPGSHWWAYARHSPGPDQDIASQKRAIAEFAAEHRITIDRWFVDESESGASLDRDEFSAMVEAAGILRPESTPPPVSGILVLNFARFGRDDEMVRFFLAGFRLRGWTVVPIQEREHLPEGQFASIFEALTHWKNRQALEDITRETKRGLRQVVSQQVTLPDGRTVTGFSGGGFPPVGYRAEKVQTGVRRNGEPRYNSYWVIDDRPDQWGETAWARVVRAWEMMASGRYSYREIDNSCHLFKALNSYNDFFRRRTYLGVRVCGDLEIPDAHPAAVDPETFERIQQVMDRRHRPVVHQEHNAPVHLLAGLVVCGYCGATMAADGQRGRYVCQTLRRKGRAGCPESMRTNIDLVEQTVLRAISERVLTGGAMIPLLQAADAGLFLETEDVAAEIEREERRLAKLDTQIDTLLDSLEERPSTAVKTRLAEREREASESRARLGFLRDQIQSRRDTPHSRGELLAALTAIRDMLEMGTPDEQRAALRSIIVAVRLWNDQVEIVYHLPNDKGFRRGTPSGAQPQNPCSLRIELTRSQKRNFRPDSLRQHRHRTVNRRGEIKLFGHQLYIKRELAGARVLVRLSNGVITVFSGETVVRRLAIPGPREG